MLQTIQQIIHENFEEIRQLCDNFFDKNLSDKAFNELNIQIRSKDSEFQLAFYHFCAKMMAHHSFMEDPCFLLYQYIRLYDTDYVHCGICSGKTAQNDPLYVSPYCGHYFHSECLVHHFQNCSIDKLNRNCPLCDQKFT